MAKTVSRRMKSIREHEADALFEKADKQWDLGSLLSAFRLFYTSAKLGDSSAQHNLGYFYDNGIGIKPNRTKAMYWYNRAFHQGSRIAASNIGSIFRDEKSFKKALLWYQRAVKLDDADANLEIAKILLRETDNVKKAIIYLKRTIKAKPIDVTENSKIEARNLLKQLTRKNHK